MASIKEYNNKLKSLKNTQKITKTMKMVSASKLRKAQDAQNRAKEYASAVTSLVSRVSKSITNASHVLLEPHDEVKRALILVFTSDKGLCGAFNHNANKKVLQWIEENQDRYEKIGLSFCGKKGYQFFQKDHDIQNYYQDKTLNPQFEDAIEIGEDLVDLFQTGQYHEVYVAYNQFFSPLSQETLFQKILPIEADELIKDVEFDETDYIYEPSKVELLEYLIPHFLYFKVFFALLENVAGEHGARMTAMDNATKNASDMIDKYTLLRNRARQAAITTELTEIVAGAEALK